MFLKGLKKAVLVVFYYWGGAEASFSENLLEGPFFKPYIHYFSSLACNIKGEGPGNFHIKKIYFCLQKVTRLVVRSVLELLSNYINAMYFCYSLFIGTNTDVKNEALMKVKHQENDFLNDFDHK